MFCPVIRGNCRRQDCRDWDANEGKCQADVRYEEDAIRMKQVEKVIQIYEGLMESEKMNVLFTRLMVNQILTDPDTSPEIKGIIEQALQAPSSEIAEKLLRDAELI